MLIEINDTEKAGFITIRTNDLHLGGYTALVKRHIKKSAIDSIELSEKGLDKFVIVIGTNNTNLYTCTSDLASSKGHYPIQTVNGVALTSEEDLYDKFLALL